MKQLLLFSALFPLLLSAQHLDPRPVYLSPARGVKTMTITGLYETKKDAKPDTAFQQVDFYGADDRMFFRTYRSVLDGAKYSTRVTYSYWDFGVMDVGYYINGQLSDTAYVSFNEARMTHVSSGTEYEFKNDSVREKPIVNGLQETRPWHFIAFKHDSFWDYKNAGAYARKTLTAGKTTDTTTYWNDKNERLVMVVNYYSESRHIILTDYYNYAVKTFVFMELKYNENLNMIYGLGKSKKGKPSYSVSKKYDEKGMLIEERYKGTQDKNGILVLRYDYTFYTKEELGD